MKGMRASNLMLDALEQGEGPSTPVRGEQNSLVAFVRSREGALGLLSMALLIFQGTALSLTLRFSRCPLHLLDTSMRHSFPAPLNIKKLPLINHGSEDYTLVKIVKSPCMFSPPIKVMGAGNTV
jgi:hypothetical protein